MQHVADPGARVAIGNQLEDLALPLAQAAERADTAAVADTLRDDFRDPRAEATPPRLHDPHGIYDLTTRRIFQEIAAHSGLEGMKDVLGPRMHRQDHDLYIGVCRDDLPGGFDSVELRHRDDEYSDPRGEAPDFRNGLPTIRRRTNHLDIRLGIQQRRQTITHDRVIVSQKDGRSWHHPSFRNVYAAARPTLAGANSTQR